MIIKNIKTIKIVNLKIVANKIKNDWSLLKDMLQINFHNKRHLKYSK